ncbi:alpha/beta hydrolase family protein [Vibrio tubiashii]|uniref:alpha/beta hydrolase family protein n=2 Tax=Vibrio tubiashii TaxID=29498 RepID=UPI0031F3189D
MRLNHFWALLSMLFATNWCYLAFASDTSQIHSFKHGENSLSAYYKAPDNNAQVKGVVIFVSGDGDIPYDAYGYYDAIWERLLKSGYAIFSWDKPGVGESSGNWLGQSMADRRSEVEAAIAYVKRTYPDQSNRLGIFGFSQAGWVVPSLLKEHQDVSFMIGVGYSINWMEQSWYMTQLRLKREGVSEAEFLNAKSQHLAEDSFWKGDPSYADYLQTLDDSDDVMSEARFYFVKRNVNSDSSKDFAGIEKPLLVLLGENDELVNVENTYQVLTSIFDKSQNTTIKLIPNATHGLLKYPEISSQTSSLNLLFKLWFWGESIYAPQFLKSIEEWLLTLDT